MDLALTLRPLAQDGDADAQFLLGVHLVTLRDLVNGVPWLQKSAEQGHADAQCAWGAMGHGDERRSTTSDDAEL